VTQQEIDEARARLVAPLTRAREIIDEARYVADASGLALVASLTFGKRKPPAEPEPEGDGFADGLDEEPDE
jgi:hypothetical protein